MTAAKKNLNLNINIEGLQIEKLIESQTKLLKMRADYQKSVMELYWFAGVQNLGF